MDWTADIDDEYMEANILEDNSNIIATIFMDERTPEFAHLIAAAPELLEALKAFVSAVDTDVICVRPSDRDTLITILSDANDAIAKAEGKS